MFEEAEKFAITFDLDLELVYKVKLDFVLEQLASASVGGYGEGVWSELVEEAKTNLMKITDEQYVVEYCLKAPWPTFETAEKMLNHAATRYSSLQIQEALARLATFCSLHGLDNFNGIAWIEFLNSMDNLGDILAHLREGDLKGAQLIWLRYEGHIAAEFDERNLKAVLDVIPEDLPSQDLCPWFRTVFVPFVRRVLPSGQKILERWLEQRARNLELTEKDDDYGAEEVESLKSLVSNLRQLLDLHRKYSCRLSLSVFEKVCFLFSRGEPISSVVVRCFTEALPENRLSRLLHKHMFEEAEKFAITFDLDLELVYKVKLDFVLEQLTSASVGGYGEGVWSELVEEAKTNLMKITDEQYVVEYCLKAPWPTFETAEKMLNHVATRYSSLQIQEALARLATFCSLHGLDNFNGIAWIEFLNSMDNLGDILAHLREGDLKGAQLIWLRYEGHIAAEFDERNLKAVLDVIPEDLPSEDLCPWFRTVFVPFVRRVLPSGQKVLERWLEQRARNLELTEKV
ncbi:kinetochore-associated protein 1-like [Trematomus bernacchii]|uniref:kinetochore-associated protein 1-like n=1 Tax=Trematomus bernacchii TaxID=40690 RepID=UPI00146C450B|nr:kinetochore-associated protein 1-like [Trematomus bernacchii]